MQGVRFVAPHGVIRVGRLEGDTVIDVETAASMGFVPTPEAWNRLANAAASSAYPLPGVRLLAPVTPRKLICVGGNYRDHLEESGVPVPAAPILFAKLSSAVIGPYDPIVLPRQEAAPDFEAEVGVVMGRWLRNADESIARAAIGGFIAINDVTGRAAQQDDGQWMRGKSFDTFAPIGPCIASPEHVDPQSISLRCLLSGELMQESSTANLVHPIVDLMSYISHQFTLEPGDIIATGTPGGVGFARDPQRLLQHGDLLETWVEGVGTLRNPVVADLESW